MCCFFTSLAYQWSTSKKRKFYFYPALWQPTLLPPAWFSASVSSGKLIHILLGYRIQSSVTSCWRCGRVRFGNLLQNCLNVISRTHKWQSEKTQLRYYNLLWLTTSFCFGAILVMLSNLSAESSCISGKNVTLQLYSVGRLVVAETVAGRTLAPQHIMHLARPAGLGFLGSTPVTLLQLHLVFGSQMWFCKILRCLAEQNRLLCFFPLALYLPHGACQYVCLGTYCTSRPWTWSFWTTSFNKGYAYLSRLMNVALVNNWEPVFIY